MGSEDRSSGVVAAIMNRGLLLFAAVLTAYLAVLKLHHPAPSPMATPIQPISISKAHSRGSLDAPVVLIEFADFQCPYCGHFVATTLPTLERDFISVGKVRLAFLNFPLPNHAVALQAASVAACSEVLGAFWPVHDWLYRQSAISPESLRVVPTLFGFERTSFDACVAAQGRAFAMDEQSSGAKLGVASTPTFLVGRRITGDLVRVDSVLEGTYPVAKFVEVLERELSKDSGMKKQLSQ